MSDKILIGVHNGPMHSDEVFGVAALSLIMDVDFVRTRDPEILKKCDMRVDVGDNYNHATKDYDHHMAWFNVRHKPPYKKRLPDGTYKEFKEGPTRSGFGLIWLHYGLEIIKEVISLAYPPEHLKRFKEIDYLDIFESLDNGFVSYIDAVDNGQQREFYLDQSPFRGSDLSRLISVYNPTVMEQQNWLREDTSDIQYAAQFQAAVNLAKIILRRDILNQSELIYYRGPFMDKLSAMGENDQILVLDEFMPWAYAYNRAGNATNGLEMMVYPSASGTWMCQTPYYYIKRDGGTYPSKMADGSQRRYKHQAPVDICGLRDQELSDKVGIPDLVFVHKGGHLGVAKTKEGAIQLAQYFIDKSRK